MARKTTNRRHNEHFCTVSLGGRKSCPTCNRKLPDGESVWSWGEYVRARWRTVLHFCVQCYDAEVKRPLLAHAGPCGCEIVLCSYQGERLPDWLNLSPSVTEVDAPPGV